MTVIFAPKTLMLTWRWFFSSLSKARNERRVFDEREARTEAVQGEVMHNRLPWNPSS